MSRRSSRPDHNGAGEVILEGDSRVKVINHYGDEVLKVDDV